MRVVLIHNPGAGDDSSPAQQELTQWIRAAGHEVQYFLSRQWQAALHQPADILAIAGGDGTVAKIARKMIGGRHVPIALLPTGTANNVSKTLGIDSVPLQKLISGWASAARKRVDSGIVTAPWGIRRFIEGVGAGLFAHALPEADGNRTLAALNDAEVKATYAQQLLREELKKCAPTPLTLRVDGAEVSGEFVLVEIMNSRFIGPNLYLAPRGAPNDGLFDVVLATEEQRRELDDYLATWQEGTMLPAQLKTFKAARVEMEWTGFDLHIDDTLFPRDRNMRSCAPARVAVEADRGALEFLVPAST